MTFIIPVYNNMPKNACPMPTNNTQPEPQPEPDPEPEPGPEEPAFTKGDINADGVIDEEDALAIQRHITEVELLTGDHLDAADINGDGRVNALDVLYVKKHIAGKFTIKK